MVDNTSNTTNTSVTSDTTDTTLIKNELVKLVTCDKASWEEVFSDSLTDRILKVLCESKEPLSYRQIAEKLEKDESNIRHAILRKEAFFDRKGSQGQKCHNFLSQVAIEEINSRILKIQAENEAEEAEIEQQELSKKNMEEQLEAVKSFAHAVKQKREKSTLFIDFQTILEYDPNLADFFLDKPEEFIELYKMAFTNEFQVRVFNLPQSSFVGIENIRPCHLDKLVTIEGRVVSMSGVRPKIASAKFECPACGTILTVIQFEDKFREPARCSCGRRGGFKVLNKEIVPVSRIILEDLQEKTDNPHTQRIKAIISDDLTDSEKIKIFTPGNEVRATGIIKELKIQNKGGGISTTMDFGFNIVSAESIEQEIDVQEFSEQETKEIVELAENIDKKGLSELTESFAPDVYGYDHIKEAICLMLSNKKNEPKVKKTRNKPNILLIGDPGVSKSVLCNFGISVTPNSRKAVGGGSSAVGITASVIKEDESLGGYRVEPGALVLAKDILFIDELNNLSDEDKPKLQEGMSEQHVSINKANLHVQLKVTAGILACANPKYGSFDPSASYIEQFNIPSPIINRFDTIFVIHDSIDEKKDKAVAKKMIDRERNLIVQKYSTEFLKKFFVYIKNQEEPVIDDYISETIQEIYSKSRKSNFGSKVIVNARYIEALTRMIKASAKLRLSKKVELKDIERSIDILSKSHYQTEEYSRFNFASAEADEFFKKEVKQLEI